MYHLLVALPVLAVVAWVVAQPSTTQAAPAALDCWHAGAADAPLPYGTVEVHYWTCYDAVFSPAGIPPARYGEAALCDSELLTSDPTSVRLRCDWYPSRDVAVWYMVTSQRYVYCETLDLTYGFQSRDRLGSSYLGCFTREVFLRALLG